MFFGRYIGWISFILATLLMSEHIPLIKTIEAGPSEASQLLSVVSELASGVKDNIVGMVTRPSDPFHENEQNQTLPNPESSPPPVEPISEPPLEPISEPPPPPEKSPVSDSTSHFWTREGTKITVVFDLEWIPGFGVLRKVFGWIDSVEPSYWVYVVVVPAVLGFSGGLGYGFGGWCRGCLSKWKSLKAIEKDGTVTTGKETERSEPAKAYLKSRLRQSYMMPSNFQHVLNPRRLRVSTTVEPRHVEETNPVIDEIAKKEEDADPLAVTPSLSDAPWLSPEHPTSQTQLNYDFDLPPYDGFQPKPTVSDPNELPDMLMGSSPPPQTPNEPNPPKISDPWNNYTLDNRVTVC